MNAKLVIAASVAATVALPLTGWAAGDKSASDNAGAEKMFKALDKNKDGYISKSEAKGTPHDKEFATLDKNSDGKLSREEHASALEHTGKSTATGGTTGGSMSSGTSGPAAPGSSQNKRY